MTPIALDCEDYDWYFCAIRQQLANFIDFYPCDLDFRPAYTKHGDYSLLVWSKRFLEGDNGFNHGEIPKNIYSLIESDEYRYCDYIPFKSELSKCFYRRHMIEKSVGDTANAFHTLIYAAWSCDDMEGEENNAAKCREKAIELSYSHAVERDSSRNYFVSYDFNFENMVEMNKLAKADLFRRTGKFDEVKDCFEGEKYKTAELFNIINKYQLYLAKECDDRAHSVDEALLFSNTH